MNQEIEKYINKQKSPQKEICKNLRKIIFETCPDIDEEMKWGVPVYAHGLFYIVALKDHVNLGFSIKNLSGKYLSMFDGGGKTTKHIQVKSLKDIDRPRIVKLLKLVKN